MRNESRTLAVFKDAPIATKVGTLTFPTSNTAAISLSRLPFRNMLKFFQSVGCLVRFTGSERSAPHAKFLQLSACGYFLPGPLTTCGQREVIVNIKAFVTLGRRRTSAPAAFGSSPRSAGPGSSIQRPQSLARGAVHERSYQSGLRRRRKFRRHLQERFHRAVQLRQQHN